MGTVLRDMIRILLQTQHGAAGEDQQTAHQQGQGPVGEISRNAQQTQSHQRQGQDAEMLFQPHGGAGVMLVPAAEELCQPLVQYSTQLLQILSVGHIDGQQS